MKRVGHELGVQYLVEGSNRRSGEKLRVTAQLIEVRTGNHVWAERYDRDARDIFDLQDELARAVAATVGGRIDMAGRERSARLSPAGLKAYDLHLRAKACYLENTKSGNEQARILAQQALALDPMNAVIMAFYANYCHMAYFLGWIPDLDQVLRTALSPPDKLSLSTMATAPRAPWVKGIACFAARRYDEAIDAFNQIHVPNHEVICYLAASCALAGRLADARAKLREFLRIAERDMACFPGQNAQEWMSYLERSNPYEARSDLDHLCEGLRKAGLPI